MDDGHGSSGGHPLEHISFSITNDERGPVVRIGDDVVGDIAPSSRGAHQFRQEQAAANQGTPEDMELYNRLAQQDPDFQVVREQMVELCEHIPPEDVVEISNNPKRFIAEYVALRDQMYESQNAQPRVEAITDLERQLAEERATGGASTRLRALEHRLAGLYGSR